MRLPEQHESPETKDWVPADAYAMAGFPVHAVDRYLPRMIAAGYRVAICEQVEDPALVRGKRIVERKVIEVITPGTLTGEFDGYGVAAAGRYALSERMGAALRAEWVSLAFDCQGCSDVDQEIWGLTGTVDYLLTSNLMVRAELRYDNLRSGDTGFRKNFFRNNGLLREDDQTVGLVEAIYSFNGF